MFSSTTAAPCTCGRTRNSARALFLRIGDAHAPPEFQHVLRARHGQRYDPPVREADLDGLATALDRRLLDDDRNRPVHVVERRARAIERDLPGRLVLGRGLVGLDAADRLGEIGLWGSELDAAVLALVASKPVLQRGLGRALQLRIDRRAHRIGRTRERVDARRRFWLRARPDRRSGSRGRGADAHRRRGAGQALRALALVGGDHAVFLHAREHVGEPLLRALGVTVGINSSGPWSWRQGEPLHRA